MNNRLLEIKDINKRFGSQHVLKNINCHVERGEFISILGPSGCGKTTLLRVITGLDRPDSGSILHNDSDITYLKPSKRGFSIVFQDYALFPHMTLYDNIAYGLKLQKLKAGEIQERVMRTLELLRLKDAVKKYPSQLSGGMQQRAAIARSLVLGSDLLLLDEPFSALDAMVKVDLGDELKELQKQFGITMMMVTHDQEEAFSLSDRIILMGRGEIVADSTPQSLYANREGNRFITVFITDQIDKRARYIKNLMQGGGAYES
ncbi:MAG: ABC transporter ATP-binding protein [Clostridiaceae bacterium]|nr:ABC transporter ATP-binding protein [Clostridiaceae bacterium]